MAKLGRNAPCPCGSGRKYKKCCLGKGPPPGFSGSAQPPAVKPPSAPAPPQVEMSPYVLAKLFEDSEQFAQMARVQPQRACRFWTPRKLAALNTPEILARLRKLEVEASREAYLALAQGTDSAWEIADQWRERINGPLSRYAQDFLGLAACELWKRYCPEHPSIEMLDDAMQEGYRLSMQGEGARACDCWWKVWQTIHSRLHPKMRTTKSAAIVFDGTQCLFNWVQDFALELHNTAVADHRYAETGVCLCQEVLAQFCDEDELFALNFRADLGEFHFLAAQPNDGERVLLELIRDHPDRAAGYVRLADLLGYGPTPNSQPIDLQRAQVLIEQALARPVTDAAQYDLETRLTDLRAHALEWQNRLTS